MNCYVIIEERQSAYDHFYTGASVVGVYSTPQLADKALKIAKRKAKADKANKKFKNLSDGFRFLQRESIWLEYYVKEMPLDNLDIKP